MSSAPPPSNNMTETASALQGKEGVCRIEVSRVDWIVEQPWQRAPQTKTSGTGFVISAQRILTNAHVVRAAVDIRVRLHGSTRQFPATDVDLALLDIVEEEKDDFFQRDAELLDLEEEPPTNRIKSSGLALEFEDDLPALQEAVHVVGFPAVRMVLYILCCSAIYKDTFLAYLCRANVSVLSITDAPCRNILHSLLVLFPIHSLVTYFYRVDEPFALPKESLVVWT